MNVNNIQFIPYIISEITFEKPDTLREKDEIQKIMNENNQLGQEVDRNNADLFQKGKELKSSLKQVTSIEAEIRKLKEKYAQMKQEKDQALIFFSAALSRHMPVPPTEKEADSISQHEAMMYFKNAFKHFCQENPECTDSIRYLLEANTIFAKKLERDLWKSYTEILQARYCYMEHEHQKVVYYLTGMPYQLSGSSRRFEEFPPSTSEEIKRLETKEQVMQSEKVQQLDSKRRILFKTGTSPKLETSRKGTCIDHKKWSLPIIWPSHIYFYKNFVFSICPFSNLNKSD